MYPLNHWFPTPWSQPKCRSPVGIKRRIEDYCWAWKCGVVTAVMGSTSPQVKNFIYIAYDYLRKKTDKNLSQLQRQLQILSVVSDLHAFEPTCMETLEFYVCLEQLLSLTDARSPLAWKVISLLAHICHSPTIRIALRDEIKVVPILSEYLISSKLSKDKAGKTLQLLQEISYGIKLYLAVHTEMKRMFLGGCWGAEPPSTLPTGISEGAQSPQLGQFHVLKHGCFD
nr:uncharacterized protein LOC113824333 isoform X1 [Penaeus vannamei]